VGKGRSARTSRIQENTCSSGDEADRSAGEKAQVDSKEAGKPQEVSAVQRAREQKRENARQESTAAPSSRTGGKIREIISIGHEAHAYFRLNGTKPHCIWSSIPPVLSISKGKEFRGKISRPAAQKNGHRADGNMKKGSRQGGLIL